MEWEVPDDLDPLSRAVKELFGLSYLFPYQRLVITNTLEAAAASGLRLRWPGYPEEGEAPAAGTPERAGEAPDGENPGRQIVILPTGAGKSLCFQLPAMLLPGPTLVIYPILSLMADQERRLRERGFSPVILRGGQSAGERRHIWEQLRSGKSRFIIANPEVLLSPRVMEKLRELGILHAVIDEAHCVSEWGESFRPGYLEISRIIEAAAAPLVTAFTATASSPVLEKIDRYIFGGRGAHRIIGNPDRSNISYAAQGCILRDLAVRDLLLRNALPAVVFCSSRPGTEKLARYLRNEFVVPGVQGPGRPALSGDGRNPGGPAAPEVRFYHAGLSREEKTEIEGWFFKNPRGILVATCAYGMGVDKADIRTVIHRDCPPSVEAYLQESGRAGRDGLQSKAVLLWGPDDAGSLRRARDDAARRRLSRLLDYARDIAQCRRESLLRLLNYESAGESPESGCCDVCEGKAKNRLREEGSLRDFFRKNRRAYTIEEAAAELAKAENIRWSGEEAKRCISFLIGEGKLKKLNSVFWKNRITLPRMGLRPARKIPCNSPRGGEAYRSGIP
ncbi:MAG: DEAD/DEAH box helicase [Treponema sp.]|jgi:ATP-dependent DNA helicase RecQ|nr:DEAD/DEAH box helicase [Treponema sp.]